MLQFDDLFSIVKEKCVGSELVADHNATPKAIVIPDKYLVAVCRHLHADRATFFDMLSCITGIDNGPAAGTMEVVYNLYSIPYNHHLALKVVLSRADPQVDSVTSIWRTADWHEREAYDMFGIRFHGHPDLRRILMPADWDGYPLRKDYKHQEYYRDIKVEY
jgi:NADH-quinone oxidoreductase subunit C